jgi:hypothetical protein
MYSIKGFFYDARYDVVNLMQGNLGELDQI